VWFRGKDLRLTDHAPLHVGLKAKQLTLLFVVDPYFFEPKRAAALPHRMQFLTESLAALEKNIAAKGGKLHLVRGASVAMIPLVVQRLRVSHVLAHRWTEPLGRKRDERIARVLSVPFQLFEGETLLPPGTVRSQAGEPFSVFTPFSRVAKNLLGTSLCEPLPVPSALLTSTGVEAALSDCITHLPSLKELGIHKNQGLVAGGEKAAKERLNLFLRERAQNYDSSRDMLAESGTSRLSQDLKFGTLSVRSVWWSAARAASSRGRDVFLNELLWREFAYATLWDRPWVLERPFRETFQQFPYDGLDAHYDAWERGATGIPIVDASARQLLAEGFVHNRARMISASFLTKNLKVSHERGEAHYLRYLTDGDWALNNMGWQWSAGCGVDAAPYFRVFNPVTQGQKFDPEGNYVRKYVPELRDLPTRYIHAPWESPQRILEEARITLGASYPRPIVDLKKSRQEFLDRAQTVLKKSV
jgi:deoxyribodipyrimidine photo-lyase